MFERIDIKAVLADGANDVLGDEKCAMEDNIEGIRRDLENGNIDTVRDTIQGNRKARQDRRQNRRKMFR
jgi:hypothetical protein